MLATYWRLVRLGLRRPPAVGDTADRRRWNRAVAVGGALALLLQTWMLTAGTWNLLRWERSADFYEGQARSVLGASLAMDARVLGIEGFARGPNWYMYFGPVPAAIRIPIVAITHRLDGRLGAISMLAALGLLIAVVNGLFWRLRNRLLGSQRVSRAEAIGAGSLIFLIVGGSSLLFLSSRSWVYHEAIMWGVVFTVASYWALMLWLDYGARRFLIWTSGFATLAMHSRASVGAGAVVALGAVVGAQILSRVPTGTSPLKRALGFARRCVSPPIGERGRLRSLIIAVTVPVLTFSLLSWLKFRTLFAVPWQTQRYSQMDRARQQMLAANDGTLFSWDFVPSNLLQYWRPDGLGFSRLFPFIEFPRRNMPLIGDPHYDLIDFTAGIPATMPVLVVLAAVCALAMVRTRRTDLAVLRPIVIGSIVGSVSVLNIGYIANRYQSDFLPMLVIPALGGAVVLTGWLRTRRRLVARTAVGVVAAAGLFGVLANVALGYTFQRAYSSVTPPHLLAGYIRTQLTVDEWIDDGQLPNVTQGDVLPASGEYGDVFILDDCQALYWSDGMDTNAVKKSNWNGVERADDQGAMEAQITFKRPDEPVLLRMFTLSPRPGAAIGKTVFVYMDPDKEWFQFGIAALSEDGWLGPELPLDYGTAYSLRAVIDPRVSVFELYLDDQLVLSAEYAGGTDVAFGENTYQIEMFSEDFTGEIERTPIKMSLCHELLDSATQAAD